MIGFRLRRAIAKDVDTLFQWVNSPEQLKWKKDTSCKIDYSVHLEWFEKRLESDRCVIWLIENKGGPIGQIRFEEDHDAIKIDIYVEKKHRQTGVASWALEKAVSKSKFLKNGKQLLAIVHKGNIPSKLFFQKHKFYITRSTDDRWLYLKRE
ncbi:GNAT family N-acetyltransferase [Alphaproteobacteria bacterium]|nr:GNAT family N-acetyltransferase [Alphaproteobacteria bacterium]